jgi:hypothetical protein
VPDFVGDANQAANGFTFVRQGNPSQEYDDLAKGTGGDYRYLIPVYSSGAKIVECALLRDSIARDLNYVHGLGWGGMSGDINQGRKGDFLYLIWKTN